ncbi:MAG: Crp/Fnr family transcriptional regulator [Thermoanaerobaculia bacterium]
MCRACATDHAAELVCEERLSDYLRQTYLFRDLTDEQLAEVVSEIRSLQVADGHWLYRQGDGADRFFVVREGQIALFRQSAEGRESIIAIVGADEVFSEELLVVPDARHDLNARAVGDCTLLSIDRLAFRSFVEGSASLSFRLMGTLYRRQKMLLDHVERLTLQDATQRLIAYLLDQIGRDEVGVSADPQRFELSLPKSTLAAHLSIQPETLSRILSRLKECDYLREEDDALVVQSEQLRAGLSCTLCPHRWGCPGPDQLASPLFGEGPTLASRAV